MTERNFKVIKGGVNAAIQNKKKNFVSAFVTDTRLMGVVVLYIQWELEDPEYSPDFHQFFYYDAEEFGLESYKSLVGNDTASLIVIEQALLGGLGGSKIEITELEARFLLRHFTETNDKLSLELPDAKSEYDFLLEEQPLASLSEEEKNIILSKMSTVITSDYQLINYFLMRCFAKDPEGIATLASSTDFITEIGEATPSTLCKNTIDEFVDENGFSYLCESLIEYGKKYMLVISEICVSDFKVTSASRKSSFVVSAAEAAMMLNRPEFITVYEIIDDSDDFDTDFNTLSSTSLQTIHDNGKLSLQFNKDNNHVSRKVFRLNDDIHGLYYITDLGQLLLAAYSLSAIRELEGDLKRDALDKYLAPSSKYEFKEPILYEFIQSDYDDFTDFLDSLRDDFED